jgi:hypothetical protein
MTVTDNRHKVTTFSELRNGDTFIYEKSVYLVLPDVRYCDITYNAYNLTNEFLSNFDDDATVEPVEIELVIN